jgi:hypothetical protein
MSQVQSTPNVPSRDQAFGAKNSLNSLDMDTFLELMIAELQNQDPLNPLENAELLAQISQIREVGATDRLTETLESVLLGQNIASATSLIGADVIAMTDKGERVSGNVRRVSIDGGQPKLDLAVGPVAMAAPSAGEIEAGKYRYEVVWNGNEGQEFSFEVEADTRTLANFEGAIQINNLPETTGIKRVYRTDATGSGERRLVGELPLGGSSTFVDSKASKDRGRELTTQPQQLGVARRVTVTLNNVAQIDPPAQ